MNIYLRELRANLKSLIIWIVIIVLFNVVGFSKFTAFYHNPEMTALIDAMPAGMVSALDMNAFNLTTVTGFYGIMIGYYGLLLSIAAVMWGSDIIAKEERDKTVEFSLTLPVKRSQLVTGKIAAVLTDCIVLLLVTVGITLVNSRQYEVEAGFDKFVAISIMAYFFLQLIFLAVGVFIGCSLKNHRRAGSLAVSILLITYFASVIAGLSKSVEFLKYFSPFKYFPAVKLLTEAKLEPGYMLLSAAIVIVLLAGAYVTYQRRDLYI